MNLKAFRKLFVEVTGRYDLVKDPESGEDDGADFYIKAAHRFLDKRFKTSTSQNRSYIQLKKGKDVYSIPDCLSIINVNVATPDAGKVNLGLISEEEMDELTIEGGVGSPKFYAVTNPNIAPIDQRSTQRLGQIALRVFPSPDSDMVCQVKGRFSTVPQKDSSTSFWMSNYPETLIRACQYQIETFHRNTQGANDHLNALMMDLRELNNDLIESEVGDQSQMRDSFKFRGKGNAR